MGVERRWESFLSGAVIFCQIWFDSKGGLLGSVLTQACSCTAASGLNIPNSTLTTKQLPPWFTCLIPAVHKFSAQNSFGVRKGCCPSHQPGNATATPSHNAIAAPFSRSLNHHRCDTDQTGTQSYQFFWFQTNLFLWTAFCMWSFHRISTTSMANIPCTENKYHGRMEKGIGTFLSSMCFMSAAAAGSFLKLPGEAQHLHSFSAVPCYHRDLEEHSPGRANCPRCCWRSFSFMPKRVTVKEIFSTPLSLPD